MDYITITNDGADIIDTNYWDTPQAAEGAIYFSINAGCIRVLLPDGMATRALAEMRTADYVILSRGPWPAMGRDEAMEVLYEDGSDSPFMLHTGIEQWDMLPAKDTVGEDSWRLATWTREGKQLDFLCKYRIVPKIPWMKAWQ